jgi:hypothetical protein
MLCEEQKACFINDFPGPPAFVGEWQESLKAYDVRVSSNLRSLTEECPLVRKVSSRSRLTPSLLQSDARLERVLYQCLHLALVIHSKNQKHHYRDENESSNECAGGQEDDFRSF